MTTLVIPIYNGADSVAGLLHTLEQYVSKRRNPCTVCIVDDGSTDATRSLLLAEHRPWLRVISLEKNSGKGAAVAAGMQSAQGEHFIFTDADLPYDLSAIDTIDTALEHHAVVIGSRALPESHASVATPFKRKLASIVFSRIANLVLLSPIEDTQCGIKGFTRTAAETLFKDLETTRFCFDVEILYRAQRARFSITEIPVYWKNNGNSSVSLLRDSTIMLRDLFLLYLRTRLTTSKESSVRAGTSSLLRIGGLFALFALPILYNLGAISFLTKNVSVLGVVGVLVGWMLLVPMLTLVFFNLLHLLPFPQRMIEEGSRYVLVGAFNTILNASIFNMLIAFTGITRGTEIFLFSLCAYSITILQAFWWNKYWVFNYEQQSTSRTYGLFLFVTIGTALLSSACTYLLITSIGAPAGIPPKLWANIAILLVIPISFLGNFLGNKYIVFTS